MKVYEFKAYGKNWEVISQTFIHAEDRQAAELEEEKLADDLRDIGHYVRGTSLEPVR